MNDQLVAEVTTYTTHITTTNLTSMPSAGFEFATPAVQRLQTYALDRTAIWIG
jgi:hypothetical protein